jgi:hypothetical protein
MSFFGKLFGGGQSKPDFDELVRIELRKVGDSGAKPRVVDHLAYFKTMDSTKQFMDFVISKGYTLAATNHEFGVGFCKESPVIGSAFEQDLKMIRAEIKELKGDYDGWGCPAVK